MTYIDSIIALCGVLGGISLTWLLHYLPERQRQKKERKDKQKSTILLSLNQYMNEFYNLSTEPKDIIRRRNYRKSIVDANYLDEMIRLLVDIPAPQNSEKDALINFFNSSDEVAKDFQKGEMTTVDKLQGWITDYRLLCQNITGKYNLPVSFEII